MSSPQQIVIVGVVEPGLKLGRELGFPTANIALDKNDPPAFGVYAVRCWLDGRRMLDGVASVGVRPTIGLTEPLLAVHFFDFDEDVYGRALETHLVARLRDELRFDSLPELERQIERDVVQARALLRHGKVRAVELVEH